MGLSVPGAELGGTLWETLAYGEHFKIPSSVVYLRRIGNLLGVYISLLPRGLRVLLRHEYKSRILKYFIVTLCISFISITLVRDFYSLFNLATLLMGPILAFGGRYCSRCCGLHLSSRRCPFPERILQCCQWQTQRVEKCGIHYHHDCDGPSHCRPGCC